MRRFTQAVLLTGTALAVLAPSAAQAAPHRTTRLLGTYDFGRAGVIGAAGRAAGVWSAYSVRSGFAGDDLSVTYRPRTKARAHEREVYTAAFYEVDDAWSECEQVGAAGVARKVWVSYRCHTGFAPSYTLFVR
ncbi:hypothetical protein GCM10020358_36520 [Amorphoplanes nipponensis]|uniref:Secreted protein n=1 Tax=Actinoplanes nipponensis TaxID=135950 RepID=A0A919MR40_9ACTN|nr:hypothetical protein [Actinoplanes nipponensis]GIE53827.1 hypothetical protein Ani05nite_73610 [Actinoplanes nipponensis]